MASAACSMSPNSSGMRSDSTSAASGRVTPARLGSNYRWGPTSAIHPTPTRLRVRRGSLTGPRSASGPALTVNVRAYRSPARNERSQDGREHLRVPALVSRHGNSKQWPGLGCSFRAAIAIDRSPWSTMSGSLHSRSWQAISGGFTHRRRSGSILVRRRSCPTSASRRPAQTTTRRMPPEALLVPEHHPGCTRDDEAALDVSIQTA